MAETVALVSVIGTVVTSVLATVQNSRCTHIECCGASCDREVNEGERFERERETSTASSALSESSRQELKPPL
jgi:hypothetical protein